MPTTTPKLHVFLCHASQDKSTVRELYQRLDAEGWIDPWLDEEKLLPGQNWDLEIEKAVEDSNAVIVFLSSNSVTKEGYVQKELRYVLDIALEKPESAIFVIPVRLDNCPVPRKLKAWQYVDYFPADPRDHAYQRIKSSLRSRANAMSETKKIKPKSESKNIQVATNSSHEKNNAVSPNEPIQKEDNTMILDSEERWWTEDHSSMFEKLSEDDALKDIITVVTARFPNSKVDVIERAWALSTKAHKNQYSKYSRRPVLRHVLAVAKTIAELGLDHESVVAALLHDILEEGGIKVEQLESSFGTRVARLVSAISRYDKSQQKSEASFQRDILRKLFDTLSENINDLPAAFIKLAEKYDHLRFSIQYFPYIQQKDMADEIMKGYAPLAGRLGIWRLKAALEDLAFRITNYEDYNTIAGHLLLQQNKTVAFFNKVIPELKSRLSSAHIDAQVVARKKHIYSTFEKMRRKGNKYIGVYDFVGVRIIVSDIPDCYQVLGIVHDMWSPIPSEMDDYIGSPKSNGYQSLHTTVVSEEGFAIEVQIRTMQMHEIAEFGLAAHWRYKNSGDLKNDRLNALLSALEKQLAANRVVSSSDEYMNAISDNVLREKIHVYYMPSGALIDLPKQATPIDLAYIADIELASQTVGAKVGGFEVPVDWQLNNGERVTLLTSSEHEPERKWLTFVKTAEAKEALRKVFQTYPRVINMKKGLTLLEDEMDIIGIDTPPADVASLLHYGAPDELLTNIGTGIVNPRDITEALFKKPYRDSIIEYWAQESARLANTPVPSLVLLGECCNPDLVLGGHLVATYDGPTLKVHQMECTQIWKQPAEKLLELTGLDPSEIILTVQVEVVARDRIRLLNDITDILSELFIDILHIHSMSNGQKGLASVEVEIDLPYTIMLVDILHRIKLIQNVEMVRRVNYPLGEKPKWKIASISDTIPKTENIMSPISILPVIDETVPNEKLRYGVVNHQLLRKKIIDNFKPNELEVLCDDIEANMIGDGETTHLSLNMFGLNRPVMNLVNDIIKYLYNRNLLPYLIDAIQLERPGLLDDVITGANDKKKRK